MGKRCAACGTPYRLGTFFCEDCGKSVHRAQSDEEITYPARQLQTIASQLSDAVPRLSHNDPIFIYVRGAKEPVVINAWERVTVGRLDHNSPRKPDLDLTPFGALEKGVSRIHAMFERVNAMPALVDMGSRNGVTINGRLLQPGETKFLHNGDEIHFGEMITHVYFGR